MERAELGRTIEAILLVAVEPLPPPKITLSWLPAELMDAAPSRPDPAVPGGVTLTMFPVIWQYQRYSQ